MNEDIQLLLFGRGMMERREAEPQEFLRLSVTQPAGYCSC